VYLWRDPRVCWNVRNPRTLEPWLFALADGSRRILVYIEGIFRGAYHARKLDYKHWSLGLIVGMIYSGVCYVCKVLVLR